MALDNAALLEVLEAMQAGGVEDRVRTAAQTIYQALIDAELTSVIGAGPWERAPERTAQRNGSRARTLTTTAGDLELRIPKLRAGSFFPSLLERRRRVDQALFAVVMEAYVHGVSTRAVDDLVVAMGGSGISKSEVSRICQGLDEAVGAFRTRRLDHTQFPYVFVDATYLHVRTDTASGGQVTSKAVVVATGVTADGRREILGLDVGDSEDEVFWRAFLTGLKKRGLGGVRLVVSDEDAYDRFYNIFANPMLWFIQHYLWDLSNAPDIRRNEVEAFEFGYNVVNEDLARAAKRVVHMRDGEIVG